MEAAMRRTLAVFTALALCLPAVAEAQRSDHDRGDQQNAPQAGPQAAGPQAVGPQGAAPQAQRPAQNDRRGPAAPNQAAPAPTPREQNFAQDRDRRDEERDRRDEQRERRDEQRERRDERRDFERERDRDRGEARRYFNYRGRQFTAVRAPEFRYPYYFDYGFLGVPPPPFGTRWVRYGPDALLVNVRSGRIVDVVYDAFY
jgi:Ni/Co efflux regulator RcnB